MTTGQQASQLGTTATHSSKLQWRRNSCLGGGICPTGQESPSTQADLGAIVILTVSASAISQEMVLFICWT